MSNLNLVNDLDKVLGRARNKNAPLTKMLLARMQHFAVTRETDFAKIEIIGFKAELKRDFIMQMANAGGRMETTDVLLKKINSELEESKKVLETLANEIAAISDIIQPKLIEHIRKIRDSRMAVVSEVQTSLTQLRDLRKFFLESDYGQEMDRLERFVRICQQLKDLKESGVLDAVADISIRLAMKEETRHER